MQKLYFAELMWQINGNLYTYFGGKNYSFPRYSDVFMVYQKKDKRSGDDIKNDIIKALTKFAEGGENT